MSSLVNKLVSEYDRLERIERALENGEARGHGLILLELLVDRVLVGEVLGVPRRRKGISHLANNLFHVFTSFI